MSKRERRYLLKTTSIHRQWLIFMFSRWVRYLIETLCCQLLRSRAGSDQYFQVVYAVSNNQTSILDQPGVSSCTVDSFASSSWNENSQPHCQTHNRDVWDVRFAIDLLFFTFVLKPFKSRIQKYMYLSELRFDQVDMAKVWILKENQSFLSFECLCPSVFLNSHLDCHPILSSFWHLSPTIHEFWHTPYMQLVNRDELSTQHQQTDAKQARDEPASSDIAQTF